MGIQDISQEALLFKNFADNATTIAGVVGDAFDFTIRALLGGAQTTTLSRKPASSTASITSHAFTADLPGYYQLAITNTATALTRNVTVVVFPANALTRSIGATGNKVTRTHLTSVAVNEQRMTLANITTALEGAGATPAWSDSALVGGGQFSWSNYA